ncbi:MAG: phosphoribosylaminoimidazolecarboxamide formyltransferase [Chloroflexi bacterium]|nr:phosphoribosylaminoimidazolecarboxamide formyltransferase [Chloroflexota bacterium]
MADNQLTLRYGCNPHQKPARAYTGEGPLPLRVLGGAPGYINLLDALNSWQLVKELRRVTNLPAAASFKHVSPAGAAVAVPLDDTLKKAYFIGETLELSPLATAYARARGADRVSSFGDWVALSDTVDLPTARLLHREVSDGVIAPAYAPDALALLKEKKDGKYVVLEIDTDFEPGEMETREVFGITLEQRRNDLSIGPDMLQNILTRNRHIPESAQRDLLVALVTLKYTQSNSVCLTYGGQTIGVGAGQQSRIHCTRLAAGKADIWYLRQHPAVLDLKFKPGIRRPDRDNAIDLFLRDDLTAVEGQIWQAAFTQIPTRLTPPERREWLKQMQGAALGSDGFFPFRDSIDRAQASGVTYVVQPGGSVRDIDVIQACDEYGMVMISAGIRLFHH